MEYILIIIMSAASGPAPNAPRYPAISSVRFNDAASCEAAAQKLTLLIGNGKNQLTAPAFAAECFMAGAASRMLPR